MTAWPSGGDTCEPQTQTQAPDPRPQIQTPNPTLALNQVRPPGLWREEYLGDLHYRYGGPPPTLPVAPEWAKDKPGEGQEAPPAVRRSSSMASWGGGSEGGWSEAGGASTGAGAGAGAGGHGSLEGGGRHGGGGGGGGPGETGGDVATGGLAAQGVFAGAVVPDADGNGADYFQDRRKQWAYRTDGAGLALLRGMIATASPLLDKCISAMEESGEAERVRAEGEQIYAKKPNLGAKGVTWSQDNYAHPGLQLEYLRLKSIQRYTEGYACMQRAFNAGAFAHLHHRVGSPGSIPFRVASLGGGPGFELLAIRDFCTEHLPATTPELKSLDLAEEWRPCAEGLGLGFNTWDVNDGEGLMSAAGMERIDLAVISCAPHLDSPSALCTRPRPSGAHRRPPPRAHAHARLFAWARARPRRYVFYHYMSNEHCFEWLASRLRGGSLGAVIIVSRFENLGTQIQALQERGVRVTKLMKQPVPTRRPSPTRRPPLVAACLASPRLAAPRL